MRTIYKSPLQRTIETVIIVTLAIIFFPITIVLLGIVLFFKAAIGG